MDQEPVIVIGAGPAGLSAAHELMTSGRRSVVVLEKAARVGDLARTEAYRDYLFDMGGHRFFSRDPQISSLWREMMGDDFLVVPRLSRIHYGNRYYDYPLDLPNAMVTMGVVESLRVAHSYVKAKVRPNAPVHTFEDWVSNRFGRRLYVKFFKTYTEKVWGIPCDVLRADWAAQRIGGLSVRTILANYLTGADHVKTLINHFSYPRRGPGMMWERFRDAVKAAGGQFRLGEEVLRLECSDGTVASVSTTTGNYAAGQVISSMPIADLIGRLDPRPPEEVVLAAQGLKYRAFIIVCLIVDRPSLFPDNWLYIHSPHVRVGRIQNFGNWSRAMVPDPRTSGLGMEYFCDEGDDIWSMSDAALLELAAGELQELGLTGAGQVVAGAAFRQPKAYPIYDQAYRHSLHTIRAYLASIGNLQTIGRAGMHRYNNMDHSMLTGIRAARNLLGQRHDLWEVNADEEYHESGS